MTRYRLERALFGEGDGRSWTAQQAGNCLQRLGAGKVNLIKQNPEPSLSEPNSMVYMSTYQSPERSAFTSGPSTKLNANLPFP